MEFKLNFEQLKLKSEHLHTNPKCTHLHNDGENLLFISWNDCVSVIYSLDNLHEATLWNPIEPMILPVCNPILSVLTFDSKVFCIDKIGTIYHLKQVHRDSPDLFDFSTPTQHTQQQQLCKYEWISSYSQKCPCDIFKGTCYSDGIALIAALGEWIVIQLLRITINDIDEPIIVNTCSKQIRLQKKFPFLVTYFLSCTWKDWFSSQCAIKLFGSSVLDSHDVFILATEESKIYCTTSDVNCKFVTLLLNCPQKIIHIQFSDLERKKLLFISSCGILMVLPCDENVPPSFVYLTVTKVVSVFIVDHTVILSDGINLFLITLDKHFSKIVKQVMTPLKGVLTLHKFQFNDVIAMTQVNKIYKLSLKYEVITQHEELKLKFNEKDILDDIKDICKNIESLQEQHEKMNKYINAVSIVARKSLVAEHCSINILIYSGVKAVKLGARPDEYIVAIKLSTDSSWLSLPSSIWKLFVRIIDNTNLTSNCGVYSFDVDSFDNNRPLTIKHNILASVAENCASGLVCCEFVCQLQNNLINHCLIVPLRPTKLNALYFIKAEKREKIPVINPLVDQHRYIFKYPEYLTLENCTSIILNRNKHRISKSLYNNISDSTSKTLYLNFFEKIVTVFLDDKSTKTIILESIDYDSLIIVRNGFLSELSNNQPAVINHSILSDVQKQLCLIEELSSKDQHDENIVKKIKTQVQNQISSHLPI